MSYSDGLAWAMPSFPPQQREWALGEKRSRYSSHRLAMRKRRGEEGGMEEGKTREGGERGESQRREFCGLDQLHSHL